MMRNRHLAAVLTASILSSAVLTPLVPIQVQARNKLTVTEGSGASPNIDVIRVDENGNEIPAENDTADKETSDIPTVSSDVSYEDDLSGTMTGPQDEEMVTVYISSVDDLVKLASDCRLDTWSRNKNVILTDDLVLDGSDFKYIPIFGGIFDGGGHTISGLNINGSESYTGLFCIVQERGLIKNLKVEGSLIPSGKQLATGGIAGDNYGVISSCSFEGTIEGYDYTGGITGYNEQSGMISNCRTDGYITGMHFTGGICGYNLGSITACSNNSKINITSMDETITVKDIDVNQYTNNILNLFGDNNKQDSTNVINSTVDVGGICGYSQGNILGCTNNALVGYEHVGYNIGGIVGRQNGYINMCVNNGEIYGRKDVGGIVGQAEPYVVIDITKDIIGQLTSNMNTLHDLVNVTLNDAGDESNLVSARLNMVKNFTDRALNDTSYLSNETQDFINGVMDSGNEVFNRIDYTIDELARNNGALDNARKAADNASNASSNLMNAVSDLDIYKYLNEEETVSFNNARQNISQANNDYKTFYDTNYNNNYKKYYYKYIGDHMNDQTSTSDLIALDADGNPTNFDDYANIVKITHSDGTAFPSSDEDKALNAAADTDAIYQVERDTDADFTAKYGTPYALYLESNLETVSRITLSHEQEMSESTRRDLRYAMDSTKQSFQNLKDSISNTKDIFGNLSSRSNISLPKLSPEYQARSNSLVANIQGMSDNLGMLNNEMNSSNQKLVDDMIEVNDQFNVIMLLIADAIDGVLDADYTDVYEDNSLAVAEDCTDATVADSINYGEVHGDINTAGIAGTMAIEYDFDLESDVTGIKNAATGTTYRTKCVMRRDKNEGYVEGVKNCVGGISGLQEMGTILHCQNYGKLKSKSGDYVGGISGQSLSTIHDSYTKCILNGSDYIGGITGKGYDIRGCYSLPAIEGTGSYHGAIAGDNDTNGRLLDNYFVSDDQAGIDRVSYSGKAEPLSYPDFIAREGMPTEFKHMKVSYLLDDKQIAVVEYDYGQELDVSNYPIPDGLPEGTYAKWNKDNPDRIYNDVEITGESTRYVTTLAGVQLRGSGQSAVLADGLFSDEDVLECDLICNTDDEDTIETWTLNIPDDGQSDHLIRYCKPDDIKDVSIYLATGEGLTEVTPEPIGKYLTFSSSGNKVNFIVKKGAESPFIKYIYYEIPAGLLLIGGIILIAVKSSKKSKKRKSAKKHSSDNNDDIIDIDLDKTDITS